MSVGIAVPRPDVFVDNVRFVFVITTVVEVVILAVSFKGNTPDGNIELAPSMLETLQMLFTLACPP